LKISHLNNPGACAALRSVEEIAFARDVQKNILSQIFRFGLVPENSAANSIHNANVSVKKDS
jgi:hypothetical protein